MAEACGGDSDLEDSVGDDHLFSGVLIGLTLLAAAIIAAPGLELVQLIFLSQVPNAELPSFPSRRAASLVN